MDQTPNPTPHRLLSFKDLEALGIDFTRITLSRLEDLGKFPKRIKLGTGPSGRVAWIESEVMAWIEDAMAARERTDDAA